MVSILKPFLLMTMLMGQMVAFSQWTLIDIDEEIDFKTSYFIDNQIGYIAGHKTDFTGTTAKIYKTEDAGLTWNLVKEVDIAGQYVTEMSWVSESYLYLSTQSTFDDGVLLVSNNAAQDLFWVSGLPMEEGVKSVSFRDQNLGYCITNYNNVYFTNDAGNSWDLVTPSVLNGNLQLNKILALSPSVAIVVGSNYNGTEAVIYRTTNQGDTWSSVYGHNNPESEVIDVSVSSVAYAAVNSGEDSFIIKSSDGLSWSTVGGTISETNATSVYSLDSENAYSCGNNTSSTETFVATVSGNELSTETVTLSDTTLFEVHYFNDELGMVFGTNGTILRWTKPTGIQNQTPIEVQMYPNPSNGVIQVDGIEGQTNIEVYSLRGQRLYNQMLFTSEQIDLNHLGKGLFIVKMTSDNGVVYYGRLIVE